MERGLEERKNGWAFESPGNFCLLDYKSMQSDYVFKFIFLISADAEAGNGVALQELMHEISRIERERPWSVCVCV